MKPNDLLPFTPDYIPPTIANAVSGQSSNAPPARRYTRKDLNVITIDLATARAGVALEVVGTVLWAVWASSTNAELGIHFNHQSGNPVPYHMLAVHALPFRVCGAPNQIFLPAKMTSTRRSWPSALKPRRT